MNSVFPILFLACITLVAIANLGFRSAGAPGFGAGPFMLPWRAQDRYTPLGFKLNLIGQAIWLIAGIIAGISLL